MPRFRPIRHSANLSAIVTAFLFYFETKEKERGEKTEKVRATVSKGCLFLSHGIAGLPPPLFRGIFWAIDLLYRKALRAMGGMPRCHVFLVRVLPELVE